MLSMNTTCTGGFAARPVGDADAVDAAGSAPKCRKHLSNTAARRSSVVFVASNMPT